MKKFRVLFLLLVLTSCGVPDECVPKYPLEIGDKVGITNIDDCDCVISYIQVCRYSLVCKDEYGNVSEVEATKSLVEPYE